MNAIPQTPELGGEERSTIERVDRLNARAARAVAQQTPWAGRLRTTLSAEAARASSFIENVIVTREDALAAAEGREMEADGSAPKTAAEHRGTQRAMAYALAVGADPTLRYDLGVIRGLHFMVQESKPEVLPGRWRDTPVRVGSRWQTVYTAPDCDDVPGLMDAFEEWLRSSGDEPPMVRAAMAHFILVKIHPFKDGNGRTARALQTMLLTASGVPGVEPQMAGEGRRQAYYFALQEAGGPIYSPNRDARPWIRFTLQAHAVQAQEVLDQVDAAEGTWLAVDEHRQRAGLPGRMNVVLFDAANGLEITNAAYRATAEVSAQVASRDLSAAMTAGLLARHGANRGASYVAGAPLVAVHDAVMRSRRLHTDLV